MQQTLDSSNRGLVLCVSGSLPKRSTVVYFAHNVHRGGGQERASYEVIDRLKRHRPITLVAISCELIDVRHVVIRSPSWPTLLQTTWYKLAARIALRRVQRSLAHPGITTGIGASGGPVNIVVAQYCQEAYRQRIGPVRANGRLQTWWHRRNMARFCAEERAVYQNHQLKRVIAVSRGVGRELIKFYGVDSSIIRYIPNGVDLSVFHPLKGADARRQMRIDLRLPIDGLLACFVGGDWRRKGLRPAIESLRNLPDVHLVIVGAGDQAEFAAYAAAVGARDRVHFVGKRPDPHRYMQASDVYLFPSLYEAFSLSCIEASACGLPLLVTKINGTEELVKNGVNGFFIESTADSIADRFRQLRDDPALRDQMGVRSSEIGSRYDWDKIAAAHEAVYAEIDGLPR